MYDPLISLIKKTFYVVGHEKFLHSSSNRVIERLFGKHPLLTPELIMVDDQPYGFKRHSRRLKSLEKLPIYVEIEYQMSDDDDEYILIESFDLFTEITLSLQNNLRALEHICDLFSESIIVERIKRIGIPNQSSLIVYSKVPFAPALTALR